MDIRSVIPGVEFDSRCKANLYNEGDSSIIEEFKKELRHAKKEGRLKTYVKTSRTGSRKLVRMKDTRKYTPICYK